MVDQRNEELREIIRVMNQIHGRDISMYDESFLIKTLGKRWIATGVKTASEYLRYLEVNNREVEEFYRSLNINYSEFFRNPLTFALLEQWILPKLINQKSNGGELRVWSAGCSAGQEAYSMAMLLDKLVAAGGKPIRFRIFATDTSPTALALARDGVYDKDGVQNLRLKHIHNYFTVEGETYTIASRLRESVNFSMYDLLDQSSANPPESIYGDFDIVFCSNLLFYHKPALRHLILQKVQQSMSTMGYLVTGEAERAFVEKFDRLHMVAPPAAVFQVKKI